MIVTGAVGRLVLRRCTRLCTYRAFSAFQSYPLPRESPPTPPRGIRLDNAPVDHDHTASLPNSSQATAVPNSLSANVRSIPPETLSNSMTFNGHATEHARRPKSTRARSKLRSPRKAAIQLTPAALEHLRVLINQPDPKLVRIGVRNRGCSGLSYHLEYVDKPGAFDEEVEQDGIKVLIDSKALFSIIGTEVDWVDEDLRQRFVFNNPNIKRECGCGESFMV